MENYHEHIKKTKMKTASGKDKKSTREVSDDMSQAEFALLKVIAGIQ